jgi:GntR family transcriptional regulator
VKYYPLDTKSGVPLYVQLADIIRRNIKAGHLAVDGPLPSESQLMEAYSISRITVRNALLRLEYSSEIYKVHGKGSYVSADKIVEIPSPSQFWRRQIKEKGFTGSREMIDLLEVWPNEGVKRELRLKRTDKVLKIKMLKKIDQKVVGLDVLFVPTEIGRSISESNLDMTKHSLIDFLNSSPETRIEKLESMIRAACIEDGDAEVMGVDPSSTVLIRGFVAYNLDGKPLASGKILYLSQYAEIKVCVSAKSAMLGNMLMDEPAFENVK